MSKLTFRADDELVTRLEEDFEASKSQVLREALREYIERHGETTVTADTSSSRLGEQFDELLAERVDTLVAERTTRGAQDINVNITLDGQSPAASAAQTPDGEADVNVERGGSRAESNAPSHSPSGSKTETGGDENTAEQERKTCTQCGETLSPSHVYCPNCGEKSSHRVFCECGDELRSDWAFCPGCGRRTPAADVLDSS